MLNELFMKIKYCFSIAFLLLSLSLYAQYDQSVIDSLEARIKAPLTNERELFYRYIDAVNYTIKYDSDKALEYTRRGVEAAREQGDIYWMAEFCFMAGNVFLAKNQFDSALVYYDRSSHFQKEAIKRGIEDKKENDYLTLMLASSRAKIDIAKSDFNAALEKYLFSLSVAEKIEDMEEMADLYSNIADTYFRISNLSQAENYFLKMEQLALNMSDRIRLARAYMGLCVVHSHISRGDNGKALEYGEEAYTILIKENGVSPKDMITACQRLAEVWMSIPDLDKAYEYAAKALDYASTTVFAADKVSSLYLLSTIYLKQKRYSESERVALEALAIDSSDVYVNSVLYGNIAQAAIWRGDKERAIEYFRKTMDANRVYSNMNFQSSLSQMEVKYDTEKKQMRIASLEAERRFILWLGIASIAVLILIIALFLFLWRMNVQKKRLAEQKHKLAEQQVAQLEQEKQLVATQALLDGETAERTRLARDLHDGLGSMLTGVKLNLEVNHFENAMGLLNESMVELRRVAHHLMPDALSRYGLKMALTDFCASFPSVEFCYFGDEERFDRKKESVVYRIILELVNNALKHSDATEVMVQVIRESDYIAFIVRDNGKGFDTSIESKGIGLKNIMDRIASFGGRIDISSKEGDGTEINGEIPIL